MIQPLDDFLVLLVIITRIDSLVSMNHNSPYKSRNLGWCFDYDLGIDLSSSAI